MEKIILIGNMPPPISGQSIAFEMAVNAVRKKNLEFQVVNYARRKEFGNFFDRVVDYVRIFPTFLQEIIGREKIVYIIVSCSLSGFIRDAWFILTAKYFGHKVIAHAHNGFFEEFFKSQNTAIKYFVKFVYEKIDCLILLGHKLIPQYRFFPKLTNKIKVLPNGVPWEVDENISPKRLPESVEEPIKILFLSNLIESKGYFDVLNAVHILVNKLGYNIQCYFAGEFLSTSFDKKFLTADEAKNCFFDFMKNNRLTSHVKYLGIVKGRKKVELISSVHFFVLPTYYPIEAQPLSILECMAYGVVPISTNYRVIPEMIKNNVNGFLIEPKNCEMIVNAILTCINNPAKYVEMSRSALQTVRLGFSNTKFEQNLLKILNDLST